MSGRSESKSKLSRRKFLLGSAATAASAAVTVNSERANAFFNTFGFMKKPVGSGQTSNGYTIGQSLRFNGTSAYLSRTLSTSGNRQTWTWSAWVKRSGLGSGHYVLFQSSDASTGTAWIGFNSGNNAYADGFFFEEQSGGMANLTTAAVFRDPSAWLHLMVAYDTTQATASNRVKLFVNGDQVTNFYSSGYPAQNTNGYINYNAYQHRIGAYTGSSSYFDGYIAEVNFIDGQALDPSYFGQVDTLTGQWIPKAYSGSYGANGFYLKFADNSGTTAATLGKDSAPISGAHTIANNWTPTNFNTYDQVLDSPTNNYFLVNPLDRPTYLSNAGRLYAKNQNLTAYCYGYNDLWPSYYPQVFRSTGIIPASGKWYWEATIVDSGTWPPNPSYVNMGTAFVGVLSSDVSIENYSSSPLRTFYEGNNNWSKTAGAIVKNGSYTGGWGGGMNSGDIIGIAFDTGNNSITFYKNGTSQGTLTGITASTYVPLFGGDSNIGFTIDANFGQGGQADLVYDVASGGRFKYTPPAGFKALCAANLPAPTIKNGSQYFNAVTYTGNATARSIAVGFVPDLVWNKSRGGAQGHLLFDTFRGATHYLSSNTTGSESTYSDTLTVFTSSGYNLDVDANTGSINGNGLSMISWCWKAGGTAVSNTQGTITSTVNVNTTTGFSIASWTGTGSSASIGHGLGAAPQLIIAKRRNGAGTENWRVYHEKANASPAAGGVYLNLTNAFTSDSTLWNNTAPTSTLFYVGTDVCVNASSGSYIAYLWAEVSGFSKFGSFTGNGSSQFIYCGFKPRMILIKRTDSAGQWYIIDGSRMQFNNSAGWYILAANAAYAETAAAFSATQSNFVTDILANGFRFLSTNASDYNGSGASFIFAAFAEAPFKYATAR